jgi:hypothetical protein
MRPPGENVANGSPVHEASARTGSESARGLSEELALDGGTRDANRTGMSVWDSPVFASALVVGGLVVLGSPMVITPLAAQEAAEPSIAPMRCYLYATEAAGTSGLESQKAAQLCQGATSEAPAQCFDQAVDALALSDLHAVELCRLATSAAPAACAARLDDTTNLPDNEIVSYCATDQFPLIPAQTAGSPECLEAALDRTALTEDRAVRLCRGSATTSPIDCFDLGDDETALSDDEIVDLCSATAILRATPVGS